MYLIAALAFILHAPPAGRPVRADDGIARLRFLSGSWERRSGDTVMEERWLPPSGGCLMGMMRQVTAGRTTVREYMLVEETPGGVVMTLRQLGPEMADVPERRFRLRLRPGNEGEAVFVNEGPGALREVVYRKRPDGSLLAAIRLKRDAGEFTVEMPFTRPRAD